MGRTVVLYIGGVFLLFSIYLQNALHISPLAAGQNFLPFGVGFLLGPLSSTHCRKVFGGYANAVGMGLEATGVLALAWLIMMTPPAASPPPCNLPSSCS